MTAPRTDPAEDPKPYNAQDLIAEAHAAREAGDHAQMDRALEELRRVTDTTNASEEAAAGAEDTFGDRLAGGIAGAAEGVFDTVKGAGEMAKRALTEWSPSAMEAQGRDIVKGIKDLPANLREVTQRFRAGEVGPEELARAWTGAAATVLGPLAGGARAGGAEALDLSPRASLTAPIRAGGRAILKGGRKIEDVISPRSSLYRMRLKQARAAESGGVPSPSETGATADELAVATELGIPVENIRGRLSTSSRPNVPKSGGVGRNLSPEQLREFDVRHRALRAARPSSEPDAVRTALVEQMGSGETTPTISDPGGRATAEMMARKQQGATKNQLAWRGERFGLSPDLQNTPYRDLTTQLSDPKTPLPARQAIQKELGRRGIAGFP